MEDIKFIKKQFAILDEYDIVHYSIKLDPKIENESAIDQYGRLRKIPSKMPNRKNKILETYSNFDLNASLIPLGEGYNLIGIDVDNKNDTIKKFDQIIDDNNIDTETLTLKTMNDGYHYYYRPTKKQKKEFAKLQLCSLDGYMYGLHVDIKYNNQVFFGPSIIDYNDKKYTYKIINDSEPVDLPDDFFNEIIRCAKLQKSSSTETNIKKKNDTMIPKEKSNLNNNDSKIKLYLNVLNKSRCDDYDSWIKIGAIIYNENCSFELFDEWSKKSDKYDSKSCVKTWNSYKDDRNKKATLKSLIKMVKLDNPHAYYELTMTDPNSIMDESYKSGIFTDDTCSRLFYSMFPNKFIYDIDNKDWYSINKYGIYEKEGDENITARKLIKKDLTIFIQSYYEQKTIDLKKDKREYYKDFNKRIEEYLGKVRNKKAVIEEMKNIYGKAKIFEKMDNVNNFIFAFDNGVYDLKQNIFRNALPEELVTCTCGYDYDEANPKIIKKIHKILNDIFSKKDEKDYVMTTQSLGLEGCNSREEVYIWTGNGRNGKGLIRDLMALTLGGYFDNLEIEYLQKTNHQGHANSADPIMARKKNCRYVVTTESEADIKIRIAKLKQLSGNDPLQVRFLNKNSFNFVPKFKLIIQTNHPVEIDGTDTALRARLKYITFRNRFCENPQKDNEKKIDMTLKDKIKTDEYKLAFFHILLDYYNQYIANNRILATPQTFIDETNSYFQSNNPVDEFIDSCIKITNNESDKIKSSFLYAMYKNYHDGNVKSITTNRFKQILDSKGIKSKRSNGIYFLGICEIEDN
jgi:P4 family phage/plasmid primase-like protien